MASIAPAQASQNPPTAGVKPPRLLGPDILRGFLLVWMTLTHLPTFASVISNQTFGFVSGAEGFIFLSGFMVSRLARHIEQRHGIAATFRDLYKRTLRVYIYHITLLAIAFSLVAAVGVSFHLLSLENLLSYYLASPKHAAIAALFLQYRPSLFDILPMYVVFMALTPLVREIARRWSWKPVLAASIAVWVAAQFGLRGWVYAHSHLFGIVVPRNSTGAFDMWGWQLLWMAGLALGSVSGHPPEGRSPLSVIGLHVSRRWLKWSIGVAVLFLILRYCPAWQWIGPNAYGVLIDKWKLGPIRLVDFVALSAILVAYGRFLLKIPYIGKLASLGQASIEVFSIHILFCLGAHALTRQADPEFPWWEQILLIAVTMAGLFATAHLVAAHRKRAKEKAARRQPSTVTPRLIHES